MILFNIVILLLLPYSSVSKPFNSSECTTCIERFNYLHTHNKSIINIVNTINKLCDTYNITYCRNITKYGEQLLMKNSTILCEDLGFCDVLDINNVAYEAYETGNIKLYTYYDQLLAFNVNVDVPIINFTQKWSIKLDEPSTFFKVYPFTYPLDNPDNDDSSKLQSCSQCISGGGTDALLKVGTHNYNYYINLTNGELLNKIRIEDNKQLKFPITIPPNGINNPQYIYDLSYNGTLYLNTIIVNYTISNCLLINGISEECQLNHIESMKSEKMILKMPYEPPRCGTVLEMFCPHNGNGKEDCLNCMLKHREELAVCDINTELYWCDKNYK